MISSRNYSRVRSWLMVGCLLLGGASTFRTAGAAQGERSHWLPAGYLAQVSPGLQTLPVLDLVSTLANFASVYLQEADV